MAGDIVPVKAGAERGPRALQKVEVLQQKRHAGERAIRKPLVDLPLGMVVMLYNHRIDLGIYPGGAGDRLVQQFPGTNLLVADEFGKTDAVIAAVFPEGHVDTSRRCTVVSAH